SSSIYELYNKKWADCLRYNAQLEAAQGFQAKRAIHSATVFRNLACSSMNGKWPLSSKIASSELGKAAWRRSAPSRGGVIQSSRPAITRVGTVISLRRGITLNDGIHVVKA